LIAVLALGVQLAAAVMGTVGMCLERPHTHGGIPAPECAMHHGANPAEDAAHHHHHGSAPANGRESHHSTGGSAAFECRCMGDVLSLLTATAVLVDPGTLTFSPDRERVPHGADRTPAEGHASPLLPPPRPTLS
jgi:hypothetical protein